MDPTATRRQARQTSTLAKASTPGTGEEDLPTSGAEVEGLRPQLPMEAVAGPVTRADADAVAHVAVALATTEVSIGGSTTGPRAQVPVPLVTPPPGTLQTQGGATEAEAAWRCAAIAEADPGIAQRRAAETEVGAAIAKGVQATALAGRLATRPSVVRARRIPSTVAEVRFLLRPTMPLPSFHPDDIEIDCVSK